MILQGNLLLFTPNPLRVGTNVAYYTINDGRGGTDGAWVTIVVAQPGLPPSTS